MTKLLKRIKKTTDSLTVAAILFFSGIWPVEAEAGDLSDLFSKISNVSRDAGNALKVVFFIAGIFFIGVGIMKLIQAADRHEPKTPGLTYIFLGFLLLGVYSLARAGSQSLLGVEGGVTLNSD
ncbi:MAG: hypothetical protein IJU76_05065 [Desulfovibrionaceae bacterium]|nr:hypothetical protein [Desulfovibrionaceae bacterium]